MVSEEQETCKVCGALLHEIPDEERETSKISKELWWCIIGIAIVVGFLAYLSDKKREEKMNQELQTVRESTEMIQDVESYIDDLSDE